MRVFVILFMAAAISAVAQDEDVLRPNGRPDGMSSSSSSSSIPIMFGIEGGLQYNMMSQPVSGFRESSPFHTFEEGAGFSPYVAIMADIGLSSTVGIQLRAAWDAKSFSNSFTAEYDCEDVVSGAVPIASIKQDFSGSITYVNVGMSLRWNITPQLVFLAGPVASFRSGPLKQTLDEEVLSPEECYFNFNTPEQSKTQSQTIEDSTATSSRYGLEVSLGYMIPLSSSISLVPRVEYQYMFTPFYDNPDTPFTDASAPVNYGVQTGTVSDASLNSLRFVLGLWITL
jgi:hypothetical protein